MFQKVLVPVDLTDRHGPVVEAVAELLHGRSVGRHVDLLHVIEQIDDVEDDFSESVYAEFRERAGRVLHALAERFSERGIAAKQEIIVGRRAREIVRYAGDAHSDLIVMGAHLADPSEGIRTLGTISHQVSVWAPCSVLLVR